MTNIFSRSWGLTKMTFSVINKDKELIMFPLLSGFFSILFIITMILPSFGLDFLGKMGEGYLSFNIIQWVSIFLLYLGLAFIATFFNVCTVYTAKTRFSGKDATIRDSLSFAFKRIHNIFLWSITSATVGLLLRLLENLAKKFGGVSKIIIKISNAIFGMIWGVLVIFVVPSIVYKDLSPFKAIKQSANVLKKTWGESIIRYYTLGFIQMLFILAGIAVLLIVIGNAKLFGAMAVITTIALLILYIVIVSAVFSVATTIYNTALFEYAESGKIPNGFTEDSVKNAFRNKTKVFGKRQRSNI